MSSTLNKRIRIIIKTILNNETTYCNFFGNQFYPTVTLCFNDKILETKTFEALSYEGNRYWLAKNSGDVITSLPNDVTTIKQISSIKQWNFSIDEGRYNAALNRDINSMQNRNEALINGNYLKGVWIEIKLTSCVC